VQRSVATPPDGVEAEVIVVENAEDPQSYKGVDLTGKIALVRGNQFIIHDLAVEQHGAIGLIFDNLNEYPPIRTRLDMPDAIQYTSFWWHGNEKKAFGFAVSPRIGEELRSRSEPLGIEIPRFLEQPTSRVPEGPRTP
jgi:aminopeptidase YwaD